ncbi:MULTISPECIES: hypothetical protein [unclassified Lysinibacillus]|uniref:hypothetical protein n=1 Tax=unclassified Lysinibacillus TaxID=2636778 RepID=UPI00088132BB|nr:MULTISPECIES: hypothetical protein [unclassified Lysinibacillus]SCX91664.1 phosphate transport system substrate-binding protein [Lysinibacillus sp. SG9]SDB06540.1 phosphate transport system substrate-binding protein [Lysinibacillus sp. TC-37]SFS38014.1 phosphate transport system substrate-binding protein [Lysinibacillus sp. SG55]
MLKFIQIVSVLIGLSVVTLMVALIITLNGSIHLIQLVWTVPVCLFVLFIWSNGYCLINSFHQTNPTLL